MHTITINNLTKRIADIQNKMTLKSIGNLHKSQKAVDEFVSDLTWQLNNTIASVEKILHQYGESPAGLAIRSRRAYQWALFLSKNENLNVHVDALQRIVLFLPALSLSCQKKLSRIDFSFYHISPLYKVRQKGNIYKVVVGESFIFSPDQVIMALMKVTLCPSSDPEKAIIRNYSAKKEYQKVREQLEYLSIPKGSYSNGTHHNLVESFNRVNDIYFNGSMSMPHLIWSNRITKRKFGHFQEDTDTVLVSRTLDQSSIPFYVLDYVMYHELLHKSLGSRINKNRRYSHTLEFKRLEAVFNEIDRAQNFLNRLTKKVHRN